MTPQELLKRYQQLLKDLNSGAISYEKYLSEYQNLRCQDEEVETV